MSDVEDEHLTKFYPMEMMADRDFVFRGLSIISEDLQKLLDAWLPAYGRSPEHHEVDDAFWDLVANIRVCEAVGLLDAALIDELALLTQLGSLFLSAPESKLERVLNLL